MYLYVYTHNDSDYVSPQKIFLTYKMMNIAMVHRNLTCKHQHRIYF